MLEKGKGDDPNWVQGGKVLEVTTNVEKQGPKYKAYQDHIPVNGTGQTL